MASSDVEIKLGLDSSEAEADAKAAGKSIGDKAGSGVEQGLDSGSKSGAKKAASNVGDGKIKQAGKSAGDGAGKGIGDGIGDGAKDGVKKAEEAISEIPDALESALSVVGIGAGVAGIFELVEQSADSSFKKIEAGAKFAGASMESATKSYEGFVGITGDAEQATEAANNAIRMCGDDTEQLAEWTNIAAGAYAVMGDSIPIENLAESALETQNAGTVTGSLADALQFVTFSMDEWSTMLGDHTEAQKVFNEALESGMTVEDAFNEALKSCNDEQERGQLITDTLSNIYSEAGQSYLEANAATIEYNQAQDELNRTLQDAGETFMPLVTSALQWFIDNGETIIPIVTALAAALAAFSIASTVAAGLSAIQAAAAAATPAVAAFNAVLAANPIVAVIVAITALAAALVYFFTQTETGRQIWAQFTGFLQTTAQNVGTALTNAAQWIQIKWNELTAFMSSIPGMIQGFFSGLPSWFSSTFESIRQGIQNGFESAVNFVSSIPGRIQGFFANTGSWLVSSGKALLDGFVSGIRNGFSSAVRAVQNGLSNIRSFFPFSPAKRGPFSGHGYTTYSGRAIMRDLGKGMAEGAKDAKLRAEDALASVQASFAAPISSRVSVAGATNNSRVYSVTIGDVTTGGDAKTAAAVERFFTDLGIIQRTGAY